MPRSSRLDACRDLAGPRPSASTAWLEGGPDLRTSGLARQTYGGQDPGILHHVMGRGIKRKRIVIDKRHSQDFITRLAGLAEDK